MKKRILGILLVLVALVALCVISVSAEDVAFPTDGTSKAAPCQHCDGKTVTWLPLTQDVADEWRAAEGNYDPANGTHYYVSDDTVSFDYDKTMSGNNGDLTIASGETLCLHLNGKTVTRNSQRTITLNGTLNLMDHAANEGVLSGKGGTGSSGCVVRVNSASAAFNMYGGTLTLTSGTAGNGGCVYLGKSGSTFTMNGGVITGGKAQNGGGLYLVSGAVAHLLGGTITGGQAPSGDGFGGNVYAAGTVNLGNCNITGGSALTLGDDLYFSSTGKLNVKKEFTGEVQVAFDATHLPNPIKGGNLAETLDTCEGPFTGKLLLEKDGVTYELYGKENDTKLYVQEAQIADVDFSAGGAVNGKCVHCNRNVTWLPLTQELSDSWQTNYAPTGDSHYYVSSEEVMVKILAIASSEKLCLHLNGNTVKRNGTNSRPFSVSGELAIMDHAANEGKVQGYAESTSGGCVVRVASSGSKFSLYGGTIEMMTGTTDSTASAKTGGCVYVVNGATFTMYGGTLTGGKVNTSGGNLYIADGGTANLLGGSITGGTAPNYGGNIYSAGNLTLGNCDITGGTANNGNDIYIASSSSLQVKTDFAGSVRASFYSGHLSDPVRGSSVAAKAAVCEGPFTGKLLIENDAQLPEAFGKTGDTALYIKAAAVVKNNGTKTWYDTNADAVAAYSSTDKYLVANDGDLKLTGGDYAVDLCGANVNVTGTGSVTLLDTANADFKTFGTATVTGVTLKNKTATEVDGNTYYMVKDGETYSFHRMQAELANVSIRPDSAGIYYDGVWACDDTLKGLVESYGVAVSLSAIPGAGFADKNSSCLYTAFGKDTLTSGATRTGVIIQGILNADRGASQNNFNARKPIYARAYVKLTDGTLILSEDGAADSLHSSMTRLDTMIGQDATIAQKYLEVARAFYEAWKSDGMGNWKLDHIPAPPPGEDGVLNLLMVGNSFCYYYVEELYDLLMANPPEGINEVNIYNLYEDGCRLNTHLNWWKNGTGEYDLYKTDASGRKLLGEEDTWTLEQALIMENWDYISLQGMPSDNQSYPKAEETGMHLRVAELAEPLLDRFHELHPEAQLLWHRTWYFEIGRVSNGFTYTEEYGVGYDAGMQFVCDYMCNEWDKTQPYDLIQVNSGDAWTKVRATEGVNDLLPFGGLCARLGYDAYGKNLAGYTGATANSGDGYHDGDIGGGQLINAYAWYETLTGNDSTQSTYVPSYTRSGTTYTLSEELCEIIRSCVHEVVPKMPETVKPAK